MEIQDILKWTDEQVLAKTGKEISNISNSFDCVQIGLGNGNINICSEDKRSQSPPETPQNQSPIINLIDAPELTTFYNRISELSTLKQWILEDHTRLITIYGLSGMGKSAIALKLIEEINTQFDYIIWKTLITFLPFPHYKPNSKTFFLHLNPLPYRQLLIIFVTLAV